MMKKERSPRASKMKLLLALPIIALLVFAFAKKEYVYETEQNDGLASYERYGEIKVVKEPIRITGEVMTIEGEVIQGAQFNNNQHLFKYQSDANGQFEFEIPKGFKYRETIIDDGNHYKKGLKVLVKKEGYEPSKMLIDPGKTRGKSEVKMRAHINVTGNIIDKHNQPIEGATVMDKKTRIATTSDSKGEFEIASTQYHLLEVKKEGYRTVRYALIDYENNSCNVVMKKGDDPMIKIRGKVLNSEGIPLTGANIILKGTNTGTVVDEQGAFELEAQNTFSLVVSYIGYKTFQNQYDASDQNLTDINIKMEKGTFNIELPDVNDPNFKMQLPPPPPPKNYDDWDGDIYVVIEQMPYYTNGGMSRLALDLKKEIEWVLDKTNNRGEAVVGFTVPANGKIANPYIAKSANSKMLDASAVKIIAKLDNWSAGIQRDKRVSVDMTVPVRFE